MDKKNISEKIKTAVKEAGLTQQKFAKQIGISETAISRWAAGNRNPSISSLKKIAKATGKPLNYFFENNGNIGNSGGENVFNANNTSAEIALIKKDNELIRKDVELLKKEVENIGLRIALKEKQR